MAGRFSVSGKFTLTDKMSAPIGKIEKRLARFTRVAGQNLARLDRRLDVVGRGMRHMGVAALAGGTAAAGALAAVIKPALDVETAMSKVSTVISTTAGGSIPAALDKTRKAAIAWSNQHTQSAEEFLDANYNMASAGLNSEQALAGTSAALTLATATLGDAATAGNLLATVYNNMGDKSADAGAEMTRLSDILAKTQAVFQIADLSQLNESLKMGMPSAIQYGISIEQLSGALGALNTAGLQGSRAGTSFSASMRNMQKASKALGFAIADNGKGGVDFIGTLQNIERKFGNFEKMTGRQKLAFQQAFGDEGLRAISLLLGKTDQLQDSVVAVATATGAAADQQAKIEKARAAQLQILGNRVRNLAGEFGAALLPALDRLKPLLDNTVKRVSDWIEKNKDLIASKAAEYVERFVAALPEIVKWGQRLAYTVGIFWAMSFAVKAAQTAIVALQGTIAILKGVAVAVRAIGAANTFVAVTSIGAKAGIAGMAAPIAAAVALTVALAAAAGAVGYALGSWLIPQGMIDEATDLLSKLMGVERVLQTNNRGMGGGRGVEGQAREYADGTVIAPDGTILEKGSEWQKHAASATGPQPQPVTPAERTSKEVTESITKSEDTLGIDIRDTTGKAMVTKTPKRAKLRMQNSGAG